MITKLYSETISIDLVQDQSDGCKSCKVPGHVYGFKDNATGDRERSTRSLWALSATLEWFTRKQIESFKELLRN